jgi:three-Cys-motif partner protein
VSLYGKEIRYFWPLQPHTAAKHQILRKYLQAWMPIMTLGWNLNKRAVIIDGFSGPGEYKGGEDGSPIIILKEALSFLRSSPDLNPQLRFIFVEQDKDRLLSLKLKISELFEEEIEVGKPFKPEQYDFMRIYLIHEKFEEFFNVFLDQMNGNMAPCFAFIDPFGFKDTPYYLIEKLTQNRRSEAFINFMYEDINRWLRLPSLQKHYNRLFGTDEWTDILEHLDKYSAVERRTFLHTLYKEQLHVAGFEHVISFEMKNEKNATEYFLYYGTNHLKGLEKMKDAMWSVDNSGAYTFSDYEALNGQLKFVEFHQPDLTILADEIYWEFSGKTVKSQEVKDFVVAKTIFRRSKHSTEALKILDKRGVLTVKNRKGHSGYPDNCTLCFI